MFQSDYLLGIHNFKGRTEDELDISRGDYVEVIEDDSAFQDSWYIGRNLTTNATGLFPKSFTTAVANLPADVRKRVEKMDASPNISQDYADDDAGEDNFGDSSMGFSFNDTPSERGRNDSYSTVLPSTVSGADENAAFEDTPVDRRRFGPADSRPGSGLQDQPVSRQGESSAPYASNGPQNADVPSADRLQSSSDSRQFRATDQVGPRQKRNVPQLQSSEPEVPSVSKLSLQTSPSTSPNSLSGSGPNSASSTGLSVNGSLEHPKAPSNPTYQYGEQVPGSDIDAAINEMQQAPRSPELDTLTPEAPVLSSVLSWTPQNVQAHFAARGMPEEGSQFVEHRITGAILLELDRETLKEIGIMSFGPRFEIDKEIRFLRQLVGYGNNDSPQAQSPATPMSPQGYPSNLSTSNNYFVYPGTPGMPNYAQSGASVATLSGQQSMHSLNSPTSLQRAASVQRSASLQRTTSTFSAPSPNMSASQLHQQQHQSQSPLHLQNGQSGTPSPVFGHGQYPARANGLYQQNQYVMNQPENQQLPVVQNQQYMSPPMQPQPQQPQPQFQAPQHQPAMATATPLPAQALPVPMYQQQHQAARGSEEEITGSLSSTFSAKPRSGLKSHHRHTSSATSRYSTVPTHARTKTLEDWESGLEPTLTEQGRSASPVEGAPFPSDPMYPTIESTQLSAGQSQGQSAQRRAKKTSHARSHSESARSVTSTDSKKHSRRSSVFSLLPSSPKKTTTNGTNGTSGSNDTNGSKVASSSGNDQSSTDSGNGKRSSSENSGFKAFKRPGVLTKQKTSAFQEGIQNVTAEKASATAQKSGWMHKRGGTGLAVWSKRYFTLHGTRLSYFSSFKDSKERGLIDITGHRVVPVKDHELLVSLSAAGMGAGRHCFKLVPPGPGYKKGVAFTAPRVHYFAVESADEMRAWQSALMGATIERDESIPVLSTCKTPAVSLSKAQELMAERLATKGDIGSLTK